MADGMLQADLLLRWHGTDRMIELGTLDLPVATESVGDGQVNCRVDASAFERFGQALAAAIREEQA
ncbi:hypothetical protein [Nocardia sp. NPDC049149]|uniref:hypothetical protein n=1 Tax=Nocardia sp. NPDC049149 TaxID=3364315 RepID=UPI003722E3EB